MIRVNNISMRYNLRNEKINSLKEFVIKFFKREINKNEFWALKYIDFSIEKGDILGVVGRNGAGKSTLLKIISGVVKPTLGSVERDGIIAPLLELGAGFDTEMTARENIYLNGAMLGYQEDFIKDKFDDIVDFSELRDFLDVPIKNYSSGMVMRLAFAIATVIEPEILIIDEILAVGDEEFQEKCILRINCMIENGATIILVSHSADTIRSMCNKVLWLEKGEQRAFGCVDEIINEYSRITKK